MVTVIGSTECKFRWVRVLSGSRLLLLCLPEADHIEGGVGGGLQEPKARPHLFHLGDQNPEGCTVHHDTSGPGEVAGEHAPPALTPHLIAKRDVVLPGGAKHLEGVRQETPDDAAEGPRSQCLEGHVLGEGLLDSVVEPDHPEHADGVPTEDSAGALPVGEGPLLPVHSGDAVHHALVPPFRPLHAELQEVDRCQEDHFTAPRQQPHEGGLLLGRLLQVARRHQQCDVEVQPRVVDPALGDKAHSRGPQAAVELSGFEQFLEIPHESLGVQLGLGDAGLDGDHKGKLHKSVDCATQHCSPGIGGSFLEQGLGHIALHGLDDRRHKGFEKNSNYLFLTTSCTCHM